jgi:hypothetical protein
MALGGEGKRDEEFSIGSGATVALATGSRFSFIIAGGPSERRLLTPITDTASLQTAIGAWCDDSQTAAEKYGDISTWCVNVFS